MSVPSSNLLMSALRHIKPMAFVVYPFDSVVTNALGYDVRQFSNPITTYGSVQAVDRKYYSEFGLDFTKRYINIWSTTNIDDLYRGRSGDQISWNTRRWEVIGETEWFHMDGWNTVLAVEVPDL